MVLNWYEAHLVGLDANEDLLRTGSIAGTFTVATIFAVVVVVVSALWLQVAPPRVTEVHSAPSRAADL